MNAGPLCTSEQHRLIWNASHVDTLNREEIMEILRYTTRLADLYEQYILTKGIRYLWEADAFIQAHKGSDYPLL